MGEVPGGESSNINMLTSLNTQLDAAKQALSRMEQNKQYAESMMTIQQQNQAQTMEHGGAGPQAQQVEVQQLLAQEADLTSGYTDDYPDVRAVKSKIADLRQKIAQAPPPSPAPVSATPKATDSVSAQQFRLQLRAMDQEIAQKR